MLRRIRIEAVVTGSALIAAVGVSLVVYLLWTSLAPSDSGGPPLRQEPGIAPWQPTGEYRSQQMGIGLTLHTYRITQDNMAFLYSVDNSVPGVTASPAEMALTDDLGQTYDVLSNPTLGTTLDVTAGLLVVEPYKDGGRTLTLTATDMIMSKADAPAGETVSGTWAITFLRNQTSGPVDYTMGGRLTPDIITASDLSMAVAGQPGGRFVKLLIDRSGQQGTLFGLVENGVGQRLSPSEFSEGLRAATEGAEEFPPPPGWPPATKRP